MKDPKAISLEFDEWARQYRPQDNHITGHGDLFETYGTDFEYVCEVSKVAPDRVWTLLEGDDGQTVIGNGMHFVNRLAYYVTEVPAPAGAMVTVIDESEMYDEEGFLVS